MRYLDFRNRFIEFGAFSVHQVYAVFPGFSPNNLTRWQKDGLIVKLRQGFYAFQEVCLLLNFGMKPEIRRRAFDNNRKNLRKS